MNCANCKPLCSQDFNPETALACRECYPDGQNEFETIDDFERNLVDTYLELAEEILEADRQFLRNLPKGTSKKQKARDRLKKLKEMTAVMGRETLEKRVKKQKTVPVVKLTIFDEEDQPVEEYKVDLREFQTAPEISQILEKRVSKTSNKL